jgi:D-threo-aldose 1-dehydrogenase
MSGLERLGFGAATMGGLYSAVDDETAWDTMNAVWDIGIRHFDTAPHYGVGLSERRLGAFLATKPREEFTVSTKVGRLLIPTDEDVDGEERFYGIPRFRRQLDYSGDGIRRSLDESLERMGLDRVDRIYIHDPDDYADQAINEAYPALAELRSQGVIREVGVGMNQSAVPTRFVRETDIDVVMLAGRYTLLDDSAIVDLLPAALEGGVGIVNVGVFNSGVLAAPRPGATFDYAEASPEIVSRATRLRDLCAEFGVSIRALAMQFSFTHPAVTEVVVGARTRAQIEGNAVDFVAPIPAELWAALRSSDLLDSRVPLPE